MTKRKAGPVTSGRPSLFPGKRRGRTISITMTDAHYGQLGQAMRRLDLTRSDVLALLVDRFAAVVEIPPKLAARVHPEDGPGDP